MIFDNIEFHNIEEIEPCNGGYTLWRLPKSIIEICDENLQNITGKDATGVELRFVIKSPSVKLYLKAENTMESVAQVGYLYYGSIQAGCTNSSKVITEDITCWEIEKPNNLELMKQVTQKEKLPFDPEVVRVILPFGKVTYIGIEGEVAPPRKEQLPQKTYLAYGSSITHGSLCYAPTLSYPFRIAQRGRIDYRNLGFAASAHMEEAVACFIVNNKEWDFATFELGINMIKQEDALCQERLKKFTNILKEETRPIFITDIYFNHEQGEMGEKVKRYRGFVENIVQSNLDSHNNVHFISGLSLLNKPAFISQDLTHPGYEGILEITDNWFSYLKQFGMVDDKY